MPLYFYDRHDENGFMSNWWMKDPCTVVVAGEEQYFHTSEHYFMYQKAFFAKESDVAKDVLAAKMPWAVRRMTSETR